MIQILCPSCGGSVSFKSSLAVFAVCPYCAQMLVRKDLDVEAIGKMATVPEDQSPLQIGTEGRFGKRHFTLLGRLRQEWSDGYWNEWFALFDDGGHGWLAEAQGFYMMSFQLEDNLSSALPRKESLKAGTQVTLGKLTYEVDDIKEATCGGSQGELPFQALKGRKSVSVDCSGAGKAFACLDYSDDGSRAYLGQYVEFNDLQLKNLRRMDGW